MDVRTDYSVLLGIVSSFFGGHPGYMFDCAGGLSQLP